MDIESLEINLFKASEIKDNDIILVKINSEDRKEFSKDNISSLYQQIKKIVGKEISIYFFPKDININIIKNHILINETNKQDIFKKIDELDKNES